MLVLNEEFRPIDKVSGFRWRHVECERMTTYLYLFGRLVAYLPDTHRTYYRWAVIASYRPAQHISAYQYSPPHFRLILSSKVEIGVILGNWALGLRLGERLFWMKRLQTA